MSEYAYKQILAKAKSIKTNVEKNYKLGEYTSWGYYIAKEILKPKTDIAVIKIASPDTTKADHISRQILAKDFKDMAKRYTNYVEKHNKTPNYITLGAKKVGVLDYIYMFARILVYWDTHNQLPKYANVNSKAFIKPTETGDEVYDYFVRTFGKVTCIDDALEKIAGRGYGYYYDDVYSNKQSIDRIKNRLGVNCTDATQMMKHVADGTGKYKKVEGYHVKCRGGDGHIFLKITAKDGTVFYRDPAAVLDNGNIESVWCMNGTHLATNPSWWIANLNR